MYGNISRDTSNSPLRGHAKALDIAYATYQVTDLELMETFLADFGLVRADRSADSLYMRGAGTAPYLHLAKLGASNRFLSVAFHVESRVDLDALAGMPGSSRSSPSLPLETVAASR